MQQIRVLEKSNKKGGFRRSRSRDEVSKEFSRECTHLEEATMQSAIARYHRSRIMGSNEGLWRSVGESVCRKWEGYIPGRKEAKFVSQIFINNGNKL